MERIESVNNKIIKLVTSLKIRKFRKEEGLFVAEGERLVTDGMKYLDPEFIIVSESYKEKSFPHKTYEVPDSLFKKISETVTPQGIIGVFKAGVKEAKDIPLKNTLILNRLQDPGNLGTILRTAKACGFQNIIVDNECVDIYNPKTVRSSMSALFSLDIFSSKDIFATAKELKEKGFTLAGTVLDKDAKNLYSVKPKNPVAFIIGNEGSGICDELKSLCDLKIIIPMEEGIESLNASVAASVVMYEFLRREKYEN